ncbi:nucleotide-sugar transporter [Anaeromyces robustus]|uniref:Nucleotide-sugar transporter n=1 Tax=Anaeromyces robustus TaxID=1754192 RepID=A0A1Y1WT74_9FUNG|nr:nucleotide-sugar transporter [Anaeromyces robustus]|eukprot:ORX76595.1 nucleotide-sugar transporter [Anaeromyces robustus]
MKVDLKWISLVILVVENSLLVFLLRYSKTLPEQYISSTAVVCSECLKLVTSAIFHFIQRSRETNSQEKYSIKLFFQELFGKESDCIKITIPAVLYLIQNNLQYYSASKLDPATFQITYQIKLIVTAIFSVIILKRTLYKHQWVSICLLAVGIALVQFPTNDGDDKSTNNITNTSLKDKALGLVSVLIACVCSGFAGVYFEKILKKSKVTLWVRNVQLSLFSLIPGFFIGCLIMDGEEVREKGFFTGYSKWTIFAIMCQAFGGIIVAIVVKYADNILKGFANSFSILLSCLVSYFFFDFKISILFDIGCLLVLFSTYLYGKPVNDETSIPNNENYEIIEDKDNYEDTNTNDNNDEIIDLTGIVNSDGSDGSDNDEIIDLTNIINDDKDTQNENDEDDIMEYTLYDDTKEYKTVEYNTDHI